MRTVEIKLFKKFMIARGLEHKSTKGSHERWNMAVPPMLLRPVIIRSKDKDLPILHLKNNLRTMGATLEELEKFISNL